MTELEQLKVQAQGAYIRLTANVTKITQPDLILVARYIDALERTIAFGGGGSGNGAYGRLL